MFAFFAFFTPKFVTLLCRLNRFQNRKTRIFFIREMIAHFKSFRETLFKSLLNFSKKLRKAKADEWMIRKFGIGDHKNSKNIDALKLSKSEGKGVWCNSRKKIGFATKVGAMEPFRWNSQSCVSCEKLNPFFVPVKR